MMVVACAVCGGGDFRPLGAFDVGAWEASPTGELSRRTTLFDFGACQTCGHGMITTPYDEARFALVYQSAEPVFWSESAESERSPYVDMLEFCQPEIFPPRGQIVDFGCGHGDLLTLLHRDYGCPKEGLLGVDFRHQLPEGYPFLALDLNKIDDAAALPGEIDFAFATHLLEHMLDPRALLREIRRRMRPGGHLYVEVPDNASLRADEVGLTNGLFNGQHIQYFTTASLTRLAESCGFTVTRAETKRSGYIPRLKMLLTTASNPVGGVIELYFAGMRARRDRFAARLRTLLDAGETVGLWGLGADFHRLVTENGFLAEAIAANRVALHDLATAGKSILGATIQTPDAIADAAYMVFITPMPGDVRAKMKKFRAAKGFSEARVVDPYI